MDKNAWKWKRMDRPKWPKWLQHQKCPKWLRQPKWPKCQDVQNGWDGQNEQNWRGRANSDDLLVPLRNKSQGRADSDYYNFFPEQQLNLLVDIVTISWFNILKTNTTYGPKAFCLEVTTLASAAGLSLESYWRDKL